MIRKIANRYRDKINASDRMETKSTKQVEFHIYFIINFCIIAQSFGQ